jgi:UDP-N-acetylmuramoyl-tripeptide--D-alanyl-D-alanine ligase
VLNGDDDKLINVKEVNGNIPVFFGIDSNQNVKALEYSAQGIEGTAVKIKYFDNIIDTMIPIPGFHMIYNAMAAICIGVHFGMTFDEIDRGICNLKAIGGRNNIFKVNNITVIDDCYNANPMSMEAALKVLSNANGRKVAILGDMFELGSDEINLHRKVGQIAADLNIDVIICIGNLAEYIAQAAKTGMGKVLYFKTKEEFEEIISELISNGDTVLIKASNGMKFKEIVEKFKNMGE